MLDLSYSLEAIRARQLDESVICRDLDGYFEHVWSVHPLATHVTSDEWCSRFGRPAEYRLAGRHTFIEGKVGRFRALRALPAVNLLLSQVDLLLRLAKLVRHARISAVRAGDPLYTGLFGWILARLCGVPLVVRIGANNDKVYETTRRPLMPRLFRARWVEKIVERFVLARADLVAAANQDNLNFALANGARPEHATLFRYGNLIHPIHFTDPAVRPSAHDLLAEFSVRARRFLLYVGRLDAVKHPDDVIRVLAAVRERGHDVHALLVGDGRLRPALQQLAAELGVASHVIFCGNRDQRWLGRIIPAAGVVLSPHTGRALSETALGAAPIVAYDVDWQSELIKSGATGELVAHRAWPAMADAASRLLSDCQLASSFGRNARGMALELLDPVRLNEHERDQYTALFERVASRSPVPARTAWLRRSRGKRVAALPRIKHPSREILRNVRVHDEIADAYEEQHGEIFNDVEQARLRDAVAAALRLVANPATEKRALDLGCGSGNLTRHLLHEGCRVVAADVSVRFLQRCADAFRETGRVETVRIDGHTLNRFPDAAFDFVGTYSVLHHIPDYLRMVAEMVRVTKLGGVIFIDHEAAEGIYGHDPTYEEFAARVGIRRHPARRFLTSTAARRAVTHRIRSLLRPRWRNEGDIHVWPDDHIEFPRIREVLEQNGCEVVTLREYLVYRKGFPRHVFDAYAKRCADTCLLIARRCA